MEIDERPRTPLLAGCLVKSPGPKHASCRLRLAAAVAAELPITITTTHPDTPRRPPPLRPLSLLEHLMRPSSPPPPTLLSAPLRRRPCQRPRRASPSTAAPHPHPDLSRPFPSPARSPPIAPFPTVDISRGEEVQAALHPQAQSAVPSTPSLDAAALSAKPATMLSPLCCNRPSCARDCSHTPRLLPLQRASKRQPRRTSPP